MEIFFFKFEKTRLKLDLYPGTHSFSITQCSIDFDMATCLLHSCEPKSECILLHVVVCVYTYCASRILVLLYTTSMHPCGFLHHPLSTWSAPSPLPS
jgi:hypothetical protein